MLHLRLSKRVDPFLQPQQYGFRSNRSPSAPLFLLRRLTEIFERRTSSLHILFLDWPQVFDSISHQHLHAALIRYGASELFTNIMFLSQTFLSAPLLNLLAEALNKAVLSVAFLNHHNLAEFEMVWSNSM